MVAAVTSVPAIDAKFGTGEWYHHYDSLLLLKFQIVMMASSHRHGKMLSISETLHNTTDGVKAIVQKSGHVANCLLLSNFVLIGLYNYHCLANDGLG